MIDPELKQELDALNAKIDAAFQSAEKTRKYFLWALVITAVVIIVPLLILPFAASSLLSSYSTALSF